jgi:uncharacterized protein
MEMKRLAFSFEEIKADDDTRTIEGFASVFNNIDSYSDIVMPGAFAKTLARRKKPVPMLWQHDSREVIGKWDELEEREKGLFVKGKIIDTQTGLDAYKLVKEGAVSGMSIGYGTEKYEIDNDKGTRKLLEVKLYEVSLVTFPANERAQVTGVKSRPHTIREFEDFLREAGFSREDATTVALRGFKSLSTQGEPDQEVQTLRDLRDVLTNFRI